MDIDCGAGIRPNVYLLGCILFICIDFIYLLI